MFDSKTNNNNSNNKYKEERQKIFKENNKISKQKINLIHQTTPR